MDKKQADELTKEIVLTVVSTLVFLAMYWVQTMPEWKREMLLTELRTRLTSVRESGLSLSHRTQIEQFRAEMSAWEHEERRKYNASEG
jgi:hypothetical protein